MFYLKGKNKGQCVHCPSHEVGQDHAKNILNEGRSLSLGVDCQMPGTGPGSSSGGFILGKAGSTGGRVRAVDPRLHRPLLDKGPGEQCFQQYTGKGLDIWGCPLQEPVSHGWAGWRGGDSGVTVASGAMYLQQSSM